MERAALLNSYVRRQHWLAELQAAQTVKLLAQAMGGTRRPGGTGRPGGNARRVPAQSLFDTLGKEI